MDSMNGWPRAIGLFLWRGLVCTGLGAGLPFEGDVLAALGMCGPAASSLRWPGGQAVDREWAQLSARERARPTT